MQILLLIRQNFWELLFNNMQSMLKNKNKEDSHLQKKHKLKNINQVTAEVCESCNCLGCYSRNNNVTSHQYIYHNCWSRKVEEYMEAGNNLAIRITNVGYNKSFLSNRHIYSNTICRFSISLYTASSFILALCYLTTSALAIAENNPIFDESSSDKEILDHLLLKKRYDKRLLPPVNDTLLVTVNVLLLSLASPDESSLKYEVEFLLNQQWYDPRLEYGNRSTYSHLNALHHHNNIWLPDTYFIMHGDFKDPIIPMHFALRIFRNGSIHYAMRRHLILSCQGSLHIFPFDDPKCSFAMESISYEEKQISYIWKNDEATLKNSPSLTTLNAYLVENATILCPIKSWRGNYSCLKVELTFTRDRAFYFTTVFIPGIILVTSSFITFWLEWNAVPARVMIGVTTMLNFFTTSNSFRGTLPVVSNLTAMNVWDGVCMCFIYASLLEFVCVNYVGRKRPLHNVVYRPGENPVTQEIIEREFVTALSSEKGPDTRTPSFIPGTSTSDSVSHSVAPQSISTVTAATELTEPVEFNKTCSYTSHTNLPINEDMDDCPVRPPRKKITSRMQTNDHSLSPEDFTTVFRFEADRGEKRRDIAGPNEIVACTSCGDRSSPCTHSANNGCATETCFVQVRKKEPPHPIRVAKTIDVIARITFPTAYAIFLIFFFVHYKGFT